MISSSNFQGLKKMFLLILSSAHGLVQCIWIFKMQIHGKTRFEILLIHDLCFPNVN